MNILLTGVCGFIGFSLSKELLKNSKNNIYGVDNINRYYSRKLKKKRLEILNKKKNFNFIYSDINEEKKILKKLKNINIDIIFHFAAQAGVRYAVINPKSYIHSNVEGFKKILKIVLIKKPKKFIFASSSSVYGDAAKYPVIEESKLKPKNLYAKTKKFNEDYAYKILKKTKIKTIALRLFTIYGEWGRPDMLIFKFLDKVKNNKKFQLNNNGNMFRDFTYISSAVNLIKKIITFKPKKNFEIFNICSSSPIKVIDIIKYLEKRTKFKKIENISMNKLEVYKTYGENKKILKQMKIKKQFLSIETGLKKTFEWYKRNSHFI